MTQSVLGLKQGGTGGQFVIRKVSSVCAMSQCGHFLSFNFQVANGPICVVCAFARDAVYDIVDQSVKEAKIVRGPRARALLAEMQLQLCGTFDM